MKMEFLVSAPRMFVYFEHGSARHRYLETDEAFCG